MDVVVTSPMIPVAQQRPAQSADATPNPCCHHWHIQPADGPTSKGRCKLCGAEREFDNALCDVYWADGTRRRVPFYKGLR
jgi:hypothetical protein